MPSKPKPCLVCRALNTRAEHVKRNTLSSAITFQRAVDRIPANDLSALINSGYCVHSGMPFPVLRKLVGDLRYQAAESRRKNDARRARLDMGEKQRQVTKEVSNDAA